MTVTVKNLIPAKQAEALQTAQYTANGCKVIIDKFTATNTSAANVALSVNLIAQGGVAGTNNLVVKTRFVAPGETFTFPELVGQSLGDGGIISTIASAANSLTIVASGREIT